MGHLCCKRSSNYPFIPDLNQIFFVSFLTEMQQIVQNLFLIRLDCIHPQGEISGSSGKTL